MRPLLKCANGCDAAPCPPSLVICRACMDKITARLTRWSKGERSDADYRPLVEEKLEPMTPEDTPRMAERTDRQAQIDPWADVNEIELSKTPGIGFVYQASVVDAARAADAALLRERDAQIASLQEFRDAVAGALCVENPFGEINDAAIIEAADATLSQVFEFSAELTTLRAERDAAQQENKTLREALDNSDMEVELLEAYVEDLRTICEQANIDPDAARVALSSSPRQQEPQP